MEVVKLTKALEQRLSTSRRPMELYRSARLQRVKKQQEQARAAALAQAREAELIRRYGTLRVAVVNPADIPPPENVYLGLPDGFYSVSVDDDGELPPRLPSAMAFLGD